MPRYVLTRLRGHVRLGRVHPPSPSTWLLWQRFIQRWQHQVGETLRCMWLRELWTSLVGVNMSKNDGNWKAEDETAAPDVHEDRELWSQRRAAPWSLNQHTVIINTCSECGCTHRPKWTKCISNASKEMSIHLSTFIIFIFDAKTQPF